MQPYIVHIRPCVDEKTVRRAIYQALQSRHPNLMPSPAKSEPIAIIAAGPTANDHVEQIREHQARGFPIMTLAGMHGWAIERGIIPTYQAMMDPRERTAPYIDPVHPDVTYLIASQCHKAVFDRLKNNRKTFIWHVESSAQERLILEAALDKFVHIRTGCTIGMGALSVAKVLGHSNLHLYGYDGCFIGDRHHAHDEAYTKHKATVMVGGRTFRVDKWMAGQCSDFQKVLDVYRKQMDITIFGDGLLKHIFEIKTIMQPQMVHPNMSAEIPLLQVDEPQPETMAA